MKLHMKYYSIDRYLYLLASKDGHWIMKHLYKRITVGSDNINFLWVSLLMLEL